MIFPDWGESPVTTGTAALPLYTEWAVDWDAGGFALRDGLPYTVTGTEALKIWVECALHPQSMRFLYTAHTHDYGNELSGLLGGVPDHTGGAAGFALHHGGGGLFLPQGGQPRDGVVHRPHHL